MPRDQYYKTGFAVAQFTARFFVLFEGLSDVNPVFSVAAFKDFKLIVQS